MTTPEEVFDNHYHGIRNSWTPIVYEHGWVNEPAVAYEISHNKDKTLWGLVVLTNDEWDINASGAFDSLPEVRTQLADLRIQYRNIRPTYIQ